jgi:hypothetical protein
LLAIIKDSAAANVDLPVPPLPEMASFIVKAPALLEVAER